MGAKGSKLELRVPSPDVDLHVSWQALNQMV